MIIKQQFSLILIGLITLLNPSCQTEKADWQIADIPIKTQWAESIDSQNPWPGWQIIAFII